MRSFLFYIEMHERWKTKASLQIAGLLNTTGYYASNPANRANRKRNTDEVLLYDAFPQPRKPKGFFTSQRWGVRVPADTPLYCSYENNRRGLFGLIAQLIEPRLLCPLHRIDWGACEANFAWIWPSTCRSRGGYIRRITVYLQSSVGCIDVLTWPSVHILCLGVRTVTLGIQLIVGIVKNI